MESETEAIFQGVTSSPTLWSLAPGLIGGLEQDIHGMCDALFRFDVKAGVDARAAAMKAIGKVVDIKTRQALRMTGLPRPQRKALAREFAEIAGKAAAQRWSELESEQKEEPDD